MFDDIQTALIRSFVCNMKRPSVKQSIKQQVSSNLADQPPLANGPPSESRIVALNTTTPNLADEPTLANGPPTSENSCLEYWYTIPGR